VAAAAELIDWELPFDIQLLGLPDGCLPQEANFWTRPAANRHDLAVNWCGSLRSTGSVDNWILCYPHYERKIAMEFVVTLQKVAPLMGIRVNHPTVYAACSCRRSPSCYF